jgi:hypothetical protein
MTFKTSPDKATRARHCTFYIATSTYTTINLYFYNADYDFLLYTVMPDIVKAYHIRPQFNGLMTIFRVDNIWIEERLVCICNLCRVLKPIMTIIRGVG